MFENVVLRKIFGPKKDKVTREWGRLHNEKLHFCVPQQMKPHVIKPRRKRWAAHVECIGGGVGEVNIGFWWASLRERGYLVELGVGGRITL